MLNEHDVATLRREYITGESKILSKEALEFVSDLETKFGDRRRELLAMRRVKDESIKNGVMPNFLPETLQIRETRWRIGEAPKDLQDRRVEITGPASNAKMVINALNSGANCYMADAEDSESPTPENIIRGQLNLYYAARGALTYRSTEGKLYTLNPKTSTLIFRPRGLHLVDKHVLANGKPVSASLLDFGLYVFHNALALRARGSNPYFYLPKLESHLEARFWNDVFSYAEDVLNIQSGSIKATVLIETILAAFQMDEIIFELRSHSTGLNCGRWDYIFSFIKKFAHDPAMITPDRSLVTMDKGFLSAYVKLLIETCHRRGVHAIGGMAAQIPIKDNPAANEAALKKVREDKLREVLAGHDGTWVAHPALVAVAKEIFDKHMRTPNQIHLHDEDYVPDPKELLLPPQGARTYAGLCHNIRVSLEYIESWLRGVGCVPINNLMEDTATAEISRAQIWQWLKHKISLDNGQKVEPLVIQKIIRDEVECLEAKSGAGIYKNATELLWQMISAERMPDFMTTFAGK